MGGHLSECDIRACAIAHNAINCAVCADYGCAKITAFLKQVPEAKETLEQTRKSQ